MVFHVLKLGTYRTWHTDILTFGTITEWPFLSLLAYYPILIYNMGVPVFCVFFIFLPLVGSLLALVFVRWFLVILGDGFVFQYFFHLLFLFFTLLESRIWAFPFPSISHSSWLTLALS